MQALVYTDTQTLVYREEKNPKVVNGESIVKVSASGICGSDMHAYHRKDSRRIPPLILGHEISGTVDRGKFSGKKALSITRSLKLIQNFGRAFQDSLKLRISIPKTEQKPINH